MSAQAYEFKAEIQQLLNILVHSLYTERDIFLRELISNASDALSRVQFEMLTNRDVLDPDAELQITIECDADARTLTIRDTGIGMTRDEIVENLGTIAHSGAAQFLKKLQAEKKPADVIGQFGVRTCPNGAGPPSESIIGRLYPGPIHGCPRQSPDSRHAQQSIDAAKERRAGPAHFLGLRRAKGRLFSRASILE
jgi:hypothetical protein